MTECAHEKKWPPVACVVVFLPALARPYVLMPDEDYAICTECNAIYSFISKATAANPTTAMAGDWTRAILVFIDGEGAEVHARRLEGARA